MEHAQTIHLTLPGTDIDYQVFFLKHWEKYSIFKEMTEYLQLP